MGNDSHVYDGIEITPPLTYAEFRESEFRAHRLDSTLVITEQLDTQDTPTGVSHNITGVGVWFRFDKPGRHYGVHEELAKIVSRHPEHEYTGALVLAGPEPGDVVRYRVSPRADRETSEVALVIEEKAIMTWPDGTKVEF